jgi:ribosome-associated heat shock protein Hsp15
MNVPARQRIDKWLWAARFFKTRSLASQALDGGHVLINGEKGKPSRHICMGDEVCVLTPSGKFTLVVKALNMYRGSASEARLLYEETPESIFAREKLAQEKTGAPIFTHLEIKGRPTKKWRRQIHRFIQNNQ